MKREIWGRPEGMWSGKDYFHDNNMYCKFLAITYAVVLLNHVLNEVIQNSKSIS